MPVAFRTAFLAATVFFAACSSDSDQPPVSPDPGRCANFDELRQPLFGDTHVHTVLSLDANLQGTRPGPMDAYAFARGGTLGVQPYDEDGNALRSAALDRPLDFVMLSDHAEFLGTIAACNDPSSPAYDREASPVSCQDFRDDPPGVFITLNGALAIPPESAAYPTLCGDPDGGDCLTAGLDVWAQVREAADAANDGSESCEFTAFVGYEWSATPAGLNLHRNILFRNGTVPDYPIGYFDEPHAQDLWARLRDECIDANTGCDVLSIPHNSNIAGGLFFETVQKDGSPFDADYVQLRHDLEPVIEIFQHKGASECQPGQLISDELCGFEFLPFSSQAANTLEIYSDPVPTDFVRSALGEGLKLEESFGVNPFQHGMISATDTHIAAPGYDDEKNFIGHGGGGQSNRDIVPEGFPDITTLNPGGPGGVWAEENSREAIFDAIRRRETFGTSGPRIVPRVFVGWDLPSDLCDSPDLARIGYAEGVPMGGELTDAPEGVSPKVLVSARQDAQSAPLQRIQIVKGWLEGDDYQVQVYDVAGDGNNGASVDLDTCETTGTGFADLCRVWEDPDFDPTERAFYYARIVENPTCRWSTFQCSEQSVDCGDWDADACETLEATGQRDFTCDCCNPKTGLNVGFCDQVAAGLTGDEAACCVSDSPTSLVSPQFCAGVADEVAESVSPEAGACCLPRVEPAIQERAWTSPVWVQPSR